MNIEIRTPDGEVRNIEINKFPALDGWDIQAKFIEFAASQDKAFRRQYTLEVLACASVVLGTGEDNRKMPFTTSAIIDNHLCSWQNVQLVFEEVLRQNGIDPEKHADQPHYWAKAGAEMATAFVAEVSLLLGPAFQMVQAKTE